MSNEHTSNSFAHDDSLLDQRVTETTAIVELADEQLEAVAGGIAVGPPGDSHDDRHGETRVALRALDPFDGKRTVTGNITDFWKDPRTTASRTIMQVSRFIPRVF
jgi:hypothetical protein